MKTYISPIVLLFVLLTTPIIGNNVELDNTDVPSEVKESFNKLFPQEQAHWYLHNNSYEAVIMHADAEIDVYYNSKGNCEEIDRKIPFENLPLAISQDIKKNFSGEYHIVKTHIIETPHQKPHYLVRVHQGKLAYDLDYEDSHINGILND
ncbi:MAG: PepSY-like domain-containing protein [Cytophagales bacterium]